MTAQFRIGGHYRDGNGNLCAVLQHAVPGRIAVRFVDESDAAVVGMAFDHDAVSGQYLDPEAKPVASSHFNLLPGELHNVNGEWVPVAEEAPKPAGQFYDEGWNAAHDGLPFDSKATRAWRDGWNDYQDADPAHKIRLDDELAAAVRECITPEPQRPALTWATPKPVDRWEGYVTLRTTVAQDPTEPVHPLQRMTDPSDPLHGSAFLR